MSKMFWIGVDLGEKFFDAAVVGEETRSVAWAKLPCKTFAHTEAGMRQFVSWARALMARDTADGICLEATGRMAWQWTEMVADALGPVAMVNPRCSRNYGRALNIADKNDRVDACILAFYGIDRRPVAHRLPTKAQQELRDLTHAYQEVQTQYRAWKSRLRQKDLPSIVRKEYSGFLKKLEKTLAQLDAAIHQFLEKHKAFKEDAELMQTIPGVGEKTARTLLAEFGDLRQYSRSQIVALAGLYPREFRSGTSVYKKPRITKTGNARVRAALYMAALNARTCCPPMVAFADRLQKKGLRPKQILVAISRKLLLIARTMLTNQETFKCA